jgi:hypothetical protein
LNFFSWPKSSTKIKSVNPFWLRNSTRQLAIKPDAPVITMAISTNLSLIVKILEVFLDFFGDS